MQTTFLIGSGVSCYSEVPSVQKITERILSGTDISKHSDGSFYLKECHLVFNENSCFNQFKPYKVMQLLYLKIQEFYKRFNSIHLVNYEDLFFVVKQIEDSFHLEYENPATFELMKSITSDLNISMDELIIYIKDISTYITCCTWQLIDKDFKKNDQYNVLLPLFKEANLQSVISLNHDTVLEKYLNEKSIPYYDGFNSINGPAEWIGFKNESEHLKLCKIHGSVNWFQYNYMDNNSETTILKLPSGTYAERFENFNSRQVRNSYNYPALLIGTFNKIWGYNSGLFEALFDEFKKTLSSTTHLIVSGYGFGDKGVNSQIINWLNSREAKRMIIVTPDKDSLFKNARGAFILGIGNHNKTQYIPKKFEDIGEGEFLVNLQAI